MEWVGCKLIEKVIFSLSCVLSLLPCILQNQDQASPSLILQDSHYWYFSFSVPCSGEGNGTPLQYSCLENPMDWGAWWAAVHGVAKSRTRLSDFTFSFHFPALEKEMATHSSVLAWRIPGMVEPGGLPSMGLHRVGQDWRDLAAAAAAAAAAVPCSVSLHSSLGSYMFNISMAP